jgi:DNA-binding MarR family transcriptional regulator
MQLTENQALELWRRTIVAGVRHDVPDLSARQMAVLLTVYLKSPPHTVRGLASALQISKPAISRSLDRLSDLGLLRRKTDESDRRSVLIQRTLRGSVFLREYGEIIVGSGYEMDDRPDSVGVIPFEAAVSGGVA